MLPKIHVKVSGPSENMIVGMIEGNIRIEVPLILDKEGDIRGSLDGPGQEGIRK